MAAYQIGQVLYVVLRKEARIFPVQVVEQLVKRTIDGEAVTYMVKGGASADKLLSIDDLDGEVFDSSDTVRETLVNRASQSISDLVDAAVARGKEWYPTGREAPVVDDLTAIKKPAGERRPALPKTVGRPPKQAKPMAPEVAQLGAEMQQEADNFVELADGTRARIRNVTFPDALQG